jgi:excisionase family DNA binding protein
MKKKSAVHPQRLKPVPWDIEDKRELIYDGSEWHDPDQPAPSETEWMNIKEASLYLKMAVGTIRNYVSKGKIPHSKKGGLSFSKSDLDEWRKTDEFSMRTLKAMKKKGEKYMV